MYSMQDAAVFVCIQSLASVCNGSLFATQVMACTAEAQPQGWGYGIQGWVQEIHSWGAVRVKAGAAKISL